MGKQQNAKVKSTAKQELEKIKLSRATLLEMVLIETINRSDRIYIEKLSQFIHDIVNVSNELCIAAKSFEDACSVRGLKSRNTAKRKLAAQKATIDLQWVSNCVEHLNKQLNDLVELADVPTALQSETFTYTLDASHTYYVATKGLTEPEVKND